MDESSIMDNGGILWYWYYNLPHRVLKPPSYEVTPSSEVNPIIQLGGTCRSTSWWQPCVSSSDRGFIAFADFQTRSFMHPGLRGLYLYVIRLYWVVHSHTGYICPYQCLLVRSPWYMISCRCRSYSSRSYIYGFIVHIAYYTSRFCFDTYTIFIIDIHVQTHTVHNSLTLLNLYWETLQALSWPHVSALYIALSLWPGYCCVWTNQYSHMVYHARITRFITNTITWIMASVSP